MDKDTDYHDQLEKEITSLKLEKLEKEITSLKRENDKLRRERQRDALLGQSAMEDDHSLITELRNKITKLRKDLDEAIHLNQAVSMLAGVPRSDEMETLIKDGKRLDWLIDHAYIHFYKVDDGGEWQMELDASDARNHIDREMEDTNSL